MEIDAYHDQALTKTESPRPTKNGSSSVETSPVKIRSYDPSTLLNPKAAAQKASSTPDFKDIQSDTAMDEATKSGAEDTVAASRFSNLIEKHHGVSKREAPPMKRMKVTESGDNGQEESTNKKTTTFTGSGKGGIIGQSVRDMRQQGQDENGPPTSLVDLTNDDDDDVVMTGATYTSDADPKREVCIGSLDVFINAHRVPFITNKALDKLKDMWPIARVNAQVTPGNFNSIDMIDRQGKEFGKLDGRAASLLAPLLNGAKMHKFRMTCQVLARVKPHDEKPGDACSKALKARAILFCSWDAVAGLGKMISQKTYCLSDTPHTENRELYNPHTKSEPKKVTKIMKLLGTSSRPIGEGYIRTTEEIRHEVKNIIDSLPNSEGLPFAEPDKAIVKTELLDHQKQALFWLSRQENAAAEIQEQKNHMWKPVVQPDKSTVWYNVISGTLVHKVPACLGGLFSDDMGLGKTLSILSLIANSMNQAAEFGESDLSEEMQQHDYVERNTKSTLLVCPKSVLSNWDEQIKAHLDTQNISYYTYHGTKRSQNVDELAQYDLIITSYAIVNSELRGSRKSYSALSKLNFFRVVLDEAHMIRNMTTGMFIACCALATERRWGVTGTPIQNRLDDLGALIRFIQIHPFHEKGAWELNFTSKFKSGDEQVLSNLKLLVNSVMLRRSKKTIHMEDPDVRTVELDFTSEELHLYETFAKDSGQKLNAILSTKGLKGRGTAHMLTFITRLRMICCHGRDLLSDEDMKAIAGQTIGTAIDLGDEDEEKPALTEFQVFSMYNLLNDSNANNCIECGKEVSTNLEEPAKDENDDTEDSDADEKDDIFGYITPCYHLVCPGACIAKFTAALSTTATSDRYGHCPSCNGYIRTSIPALSRSALAAENARRAELRTDPRRAKTKGTYSGPHSKVRALLAALDANFTESMALPEGSPPIRSVVFSGWTAYLDLIGMALEDQGITFLRLDGTMSVPARGRVMRAFREDPAVTVMLVSIRAGGQGLNFTAANKVYVMEPQFNPGIEQQAVDRVHRLGQTRKVEIVRFIMRDSFEGRIVELQEQKKRLAREAFGEGGKEDARQRLEGLRSLFR